jgi:hypothetical protein
MILLQENNLLGSTGTCKEYFSSIVKELSKIVFHHFKHLHLGLISFILIHCVSWTCKIVTIKLNYELLSSQVKLSFKISLNSFRISPHLLASSQKLLCRILFDYVNRQLRQHLILYFNLCLHTLPIILIL